MPVPMNIYKEYSLLLPKSLDIVHGKLSPTELQDGEVLLTDNDASVMYRIRRVDGYYQVQHANGHDVAGPWFSQAREWGSLDAAKWYALALYTERLSTIRARGAL